MLQRQLETAPEHVGQTSPGIDMDFELLRQHRFSTREQARRAVAGFLDEYNTVRRHSTNGMLSPVAYERRRAMAGSGAAA